MNGNEYYNEIAQLLYNESPVVDMCINLLAYRRGDNVFAINAWFDSNLSVENNIDISNHAVIEFTKLLNGLYGYFVEGKLGDWNVIHFVISPGGDSFNVDFEFSEDLVAENIFWNEYIHKFM